MIGEEPEWITYDTWGAHLPECPEGYELSIGAENFMEILRRYGGPTAIDDWNRLADELMPLTKGVTALPSTAVRGDAGVLLTLAAKYPKAFIDVIANAQKITAPFNLTKYGVQDAFLTNYLDLIAFLLQGLPSNGTLTAVMAFMVDEFYKPDAVMDFPKGGSGQIAAALARGVTKHDGCSVRTSTPVDQILVEEGRATGVRTKGGRTLRARKAVVSNADLHNTFGLVPRGAHSGFDDERDALLAPAAPVYYDDAGAGVAAGGVGAPLCKEKRNPGNKSFMHLHLGVKADALPADLPPQWTRTRTTTEWLSERYRRADRRAGERRRRLGAVAARPGPRARGAPRDPRVLLVRALPTKAGGEVCRFGGLRSASNVFEARRSELQCAGTPI